MFKLSVENSKGERLQLFPSDRYAVTSVSGLNPPKASINTSVNAGFDGSTFKSGRVSERNIVIKLSLLGDIEANRVNLYRYFKTKDSVRILYSNGIRDVQISGYVDSFQCDLFKRGEMAQISVICTAPYFVDSEESSNGFSRVIPLFEFPFSIDSVGIAFSELIAEDEVNIFNAGDVPTGMVIEFHATGSVTNPILYNTETGERIKVNVSMSAGDSVLISTVRGEKSITKVSDGVKTNIINDIDQGSVWLQLNYGDNPLWFSADANSDNLRCTVVFSCLYEGV